MTALTCRFGESRHAPSPARPETTRRSEAGSGAELEVKPDPRRSRRVVDCHLGVEVLGRGSTCARGSDGEDVIDRADRGEGAVRGDEIVTGGTVVVHRRYRGEHLCVGRKGGLAVYAGITAVRDY